MNEKIIPLRQHISHLIESAPRIVVRSSMFTGDPSADLAVFADLLGSGIPGSFNTLPAEYLDYLMDVFIHALQSQNISQVQFNLFWHNSITQGETTMEEYNIPSFVEETEEEHNEKYLQLQAKIAKYMSTLYEAGVPEGVLHREVLDKASIAVMCAFSDMDYMDAHQEAANLLLGAAQSLGISLTDFKRTGAQGESE